MDYLVNTAIYLLFTILLHKSLFLLFYVFCLYSCQGFLVIVTMSLFPEVQTFKMRTFESPTDKVTCIGLVFV